MEVRECLLQAKRYYDDHHRELELAVGDWVWLCLLHCPTHSLEHRPKGKLGPRYAGPFQVLARIGQVAYSLQLPEGTWLHDVFHVGLLNPFKGDPSSTPPPVPPVQDDRLLPAPEHVLRAQLRRGAWHVLMKWQGLPADEATWEPLQHFKDLYSDVQLEDELFEEVGRYVMTGVTYQRRGQSNG
jgi:hypothetical protein